MKQATSFLWQNCIKTFSLKNTGWMMELCSHKFMIFALDAKHFFENLWHFE